MKNIIFKFDDLRSVNTSILKLDKIIQREKIKITWGVIGKTFAEQNKEDHEWARKALQSGLYYFWNHGYTHIPGEFSKLSYKEQVSHLQKTQSVLKEIFNIESNVFGAPHNAINDDTLKAVEQITELKYWFFGNENYSKTNMKEVIALEYPLFRPNYKEFKKNYQNATESLLVLQGHPSYWHWSELYQFKRIIHFLKSENCNFIFPNELDTAINVQGKNSLLFTISELWVAIKYYFCRS